MCLNNFGEKGVRMLHRIQINGIPRDAQGARDLYNLFSGQSIEMLADACELRGPSCSPRLRRLMVEAELFSPKLTNLRARFYFTDLGWHRIGARLLHEARALGYVVKYTRRKSLRKSQVVYQDEYQVALLPIRRTAD